MYDMYPEWGPASHHPENPRSHAGRRRPRSTCGTTAANAPTTTSLGRMPPRPQPTTPAPAPGSLALAVIPGDGIGPEVTAEALKVLEAAAPAGVKFEPTRYDLGAERYLATGEVLPDSVLAEIREHDAILLGAVGGKPGDPQPAARHPRARPAAAAALRARPLRQPAALPDLPGRGLTRWPTPATSTSSSSARAPRAPTPATAARCASVRPHEVATEVSVNTAYGVERVVRDAFARAPRRAAQAS